MPGDTNSPTGTQQGSSAGTVEPAAGPTVEATATPAPPRAVVCDLDGVVRLWQPDGLGRIDRDFGLPVGTLATTAFAKDLVRPAILGVRTDAQWRAEVTRRLAVPCGSTSRARRMVAAWSALTGTVNEPVVDLLRTVRRRVPVVLLSNATTRLAHDLDRLGLAAAFDSVIGSCHVGIRKPDARIYQLAARLAGVPMADCVFVDDTEENVMGARRAGMGAVHYREPQDMRRALDGLLD